MRKRALRITSGLGGVVAILAITPGVASAQDASEVQADLDNIWVFIAGCLVFFMQAGFALLAHIQLTGLQTTHSGPEDRKKEKKGEREKG